MSDLRQMFLAELRELCLRYQIQIDDYIDVKHDTGESTRVVEFVHRPSNAEDFWSVEVNENMLD